MVGKSRTSASVTASPQRKREPASLSKKLQWIYDFLAEEGAQTKEEKKKKVITPQVLAHALKLFHPTSNEEELKEHSKETLEDHGVGAASEGGDPYLTFKDFESFVQGEMQNLNLNVDLEGVLLDHHGHDLETGEDETED